jgi:molecular chaperone GrpE
MEKEKDIKKNSEKKEKPAKPKLSFSGNKKELEETKAQVKELEDKYLRLFAEFENYKKRVRKENETLISTASESVIKAILPVLDDFERAKKVSDDENSNEKFSEGVSLVFDKLFSTLKSVGLEQIDSTDAIFNPEEHEAIAELPAADESSKNKIIDTVEKGYKLNSKIIRFPKVVVGK